MSDYLTRMLEEGKKQREELEAHRPTTLVPGSPQPKTPTNPYGRGYSGPTKSSPRGEFTVTSIVGDVMVRRGDGEWRDVKNGERIMEGDEIWTGPDSRVDVTRLNGVTPGTSITMGGPESASGELIVLRTTADWREFMFEWEEGFIAAHTNHEVDQEADFGIRTPNATASVRG